MASEESRVFTIGHSRHATGRFFELLARHQIQVIVDIRSQPHSRFAPQFNKRSLERSIEEHGLAYVYLGKSLGGRPEGSDFYDADGAPDYARRALDRDYLAGIEELLRLAAARRVALMCAEGDPERCHRWLLVGKTLVARGMTVVHIRGDGSTSVAEEFALHRGAPEGRERAQFRQLTLFERG